MQNFTRRQAVTALTTGAFGPWAGKAFADDALALRGDDGKLVANIRVPSELSPMALPGIVWAGAQNADATLIEFFDYNCTWCHKAASDLDAMLARDKGFRLGLVNYAVFGIGSIQAAKVQQAVLKVHGPEKAYAWHRAMFARRGVNDGDTAWKTVSALGLDRKAVETTANEDVVTDVLKRQTKRAEAIGFNATPSFTIAGVGLSGYPGPRSVSAMVAAVRKCERPVCG